MIRDFRCGLCTPNHDIPLEGVAIEARLFGLSTEVTVAQRYRNQEQVPVEAVYIFPLDEGAAVSAFEIRIGERLIRGRVEEREKAFETYDDALADGHLAVLLDQERPNVFTASVGNLASGEEVEVRITYVALAAFEGDAVRLMIPTTVSPRYTPEATSSIVGQPEAERVSPETRPRVPYGLTLKATVDLGVGLKTVESPSHPVRLAFEGSRAVVELSQQNATLDRDFVLLAEPASALSTLAQVAREDDGTRVVMLAFRPEVSAKSGGGEVQFLLDCSGSMQGDSIDQAKRALELAIRALSDRDTFNLTRFGSRHESLWREPKLYSQQTLDEAVAWVKATQANLGGTEILAPLRKLLEAKPDTERLRQVLLLTDGQVSNEREVVELAETHAHHCRLFTFGIGAGASVYLVRELARVSRGAAEFIAPGERIEAKVLRMFHRVHTPSLPDARLDWGGLGVEQAPELPPGLFSGDLVTVFGRITSGSGVGRATLHAGGSSWELGFDLDAAAAGTVIPTLWAREAIRELESGGGRRGSAQRQRGEERKNRRLLELSLKYGLMSSVASYVAIEERPQGKRVTQAAQLRRIPVALTTGWGGGAQLAGGAAGSGFLASGGAPPQGMPKTRAFSGRARSMPDFSLEGAAFSEGAAPAPTAGRVPRLARSAPPADRLYELLLTQRADGSFPLSAELLTWLGEAAKAARAAAKLHGEERVATALVLALLERDEAARSEEWRPAAEKAKKWLASEARAFDAGEALKCLAGANVPGGTQSSHAERGSQASR